MKSYIILILLCITFQSNAQIAIGKYSVDGSGLLDFGLNLVGGIILPRVVEIPTSTAAISNGTLFVNAVDLTTVSVQMRQNNSWVGLTDQINLPYLDINTAVETDSGVILGATSSNVEGVLVLESSDKALILPKVTNINTYKNAIVGTLFYDLLSKSLAVFDGKNWIYWK